MRRRKGFDRIINFRCTPRQADQLNQLAVATRTTPSAVLRTLLEQRPLHRFETTERYHELLSLAAQQNKLGGLVKHALSTNPNKPELRHALRELNKTSQAIRDLAQNVLESS